ncbi:MAG: hypothetical protein AB7Q17_10360 [Phycisphaerae bacterium]
MLHSWTVRFSALTASLILLSARAGADEACGDWQAVDSPNPSTVNRVLHIAGSSPENLWLLGHAGPTYPGTPMIWRRQGAGWESVPLPDTRHLGSLPNFNAIIRLPNGDVLVGGNVHTTYPIDNLPFVARWNGSAWAEVTGIALRPQTVYPYGARGGFIYDFFAASSDDIWAVGHAASMGSGGSVPMAVHLDGSTWTEAQTPIVGNRTNQIIAVDGSGSSDIWAVGVYRDIAGAYTPMTMHWNGEGWTYHAAPVGATGSFDAVAVTSPTDAWALGAAMLAHWDGGSWESMPLPAGASSAAIEAVASDDIWVAHMTGGYFHWGGAAWSFVPSPFTSPPGFFTQIRDFASFGACNVWSAGSILALDGSQASTTIVERLAAPATAPGDLNCDGVVNNFDIDPFVLALTDAAAYRASHPDCEITNADANGDGALNNFDIDAFVALLAGT